MEKWYVRAIEAPTHIERALYSLRLELGKQMNFTNFPPLPFIITAFSKTPLVSEKRKTLYLEDLLGEGGLIMDTWVEKGPLCYWGSSRLNKLLELNPSLSASLEGNLPFFEGKGFLMGKGQPSLNLSPVTWKKASIKEYLVDFSPERIPGVKVDWPFAVTWSCLSD